MTSTWMSILATAIPSLATAVAALWGARGVGAERKRLKHDIEIVNSLPSESRAYVAALALVEARIEQLRKREVNGFRNFSQIFSGMLLVSFFGYLFWLFSALGGLWHLSLPFIGLMVVMGLMLTAEGFTLGERNEKGGLIKKGIARRTTRVQQQSTVPALAEDGPKELHRAVKHQV